MRVRAHSVTAYLRRQWMGALALFLVLSGGVADAANTIFSTDIVDGQVKIADVGQGAVASDEVKNDSILAADVAPNSLASGRILDATLTGADVKDNALKGADIDESTLSGIGGGGPAGGDLSGSYPNPSIRSNAVGSPEVAADSLTGADIGDESLDTNDIASGQLNDDDIGEAQFVNFTGTIGTVQGNDCDYKKVTGLPVHNKDHLVLTPEVTTSETNLTYTPKWDASEPGDMWIQVCNASGAAIDGGTSKFNLLVIDAG